MITYTDQRVLEKKMKAVPRVHQINALTVPRSQSPL